MIKIEHNDLEKISENYSEIIKAIFLNKIDIIKCIVLILKKDDIAEKKTVNKKVDEFTSALKVVIGRDELLKSKHPKGKGKKTSDLIYTINYYKIKSDKRSKCRKTKKYDDLINKVDLIKKFINSYDLFGSEPEKLIILNEKLKNTIGTINKKLYDYFFNYKNFYNEINNNLGKTIDLKCCPYCNRNYITYIPDEGKRIVGPTYDHFFSKSRYVYLTLSFYNLIPSCYVCNSNLKLNIDFNLKTHLHPYCDGFGNDVFFDFELSTNDYLGKKTICFNPYLDYNKKITSKKQKQIFGIDTDKDTGNLKVFKLQEIYKSHGDSVEEIYKKFDKSSPFYIGSISKLISKLKTSEEEFYRFYFRNYYNIIDFNKRPLAKLDRDIYNKLKLISEFNHK